MDGEETFMFISNRRRVSLTELCAVHLIRRGPGAYDVGVHGFFPHSGIQVSKKQHVFPCPLVKIRSFIHSHTHSRTQIGYYCVVPLEFPYSLYCDTSQYLPLSFLYHYVF